MTNADRGRSIEHLLRRSFRPDQEARDGACPDAETLAALADSTDAVLGAARRDIEAHVADCHQCQAVMAAMVRAEPAAGSSADESAMAVAWWKRGRALNWLATAAVATTVVALWVAVPGQRTPRPEEPPPEQQVTAAPPAEPESRPPTALFRDAPRSQPDGLRANADTLARAGEPPSTLERAAPAESRTDEKPEAPTQGSLEASSASKAAVPRDENRSRETPSESGAPVPGRVLGRQAAPAAAALAATDAGAKRVVGVLEVMSSDPQIRWRVGPGSSVQYSADGGATWSPQPITTGSALTAGSSPAPTVCWLVGGAGTVFRTTDSGRRWQRVPFPETADLTAVIGSTALAATVDLADGRRFRTSDGGQNWAPLPE